MEKRFVRNLYNNSNNIYLIQRLNNAKELNDFLSMIKNYKNYSCFDTFCKKTDIVYNKWKLLHVF